MPKLLKFFFGLTSLGLISFVLIIWLGEAHDPRSAKELAIDANLKEMLADGRQKIKISELIEGDWDMACYFPSYSNSGDILIKYLPQKLARQNEIVYSDRFWGVSLVNESKKLVKNFAFEKALSEPLLDDARYCLPFNSAGFTASSGKYVHKWKVVQ